MKNSSVKLKTHEILLNSVYIQTNAHFLHQPSSAPKNAALWRESEKLQLSAPAGAALTTFSHAENAFTFRLKTETQARGEKKGTWQLT